MVCCKFSVWGLGSGFGVSKSGHLIFDIEKKKLVATFLTFAGILLRDMARLVKLHA